MKVCHTWCVACSAFVILLSESAVAERSWTAENEVPDTSMLQVQVSFPQQPGDVWEAYQHLQYLGIAYHKSGVWVLKQLVHSIFPAIGAPDSAIGEWEVPCYPGCCSNRSAPIMVLTDMYNPDEEASSRAKALQGLRVAGSVRDPLEMVASAYCYHHRGQEPLNLMFWPPGSLMAMDEHEGVAFAGSRMLPLVKQMTAVFADPKPDTFRLSYENLTVSSAGFDAEVRRLLRFWFPSLTAAATSRALRAASVADQHRHPEEKNFAHGNDEECMVRARLATQKALPAELLATYRALQRRLGYQPT
mmetsp:Transcript_13042/g.24660  ORF Transcript_13042/g.24660 Transcript_13042/m.24660 type:complete len:303 (+) Transcript_13042:80-988(+)